MGEDKMNKIAAPAMSASLGERALAAGAYWVEGMREVDGALCVAPFEGGPWMWAVDGDTITTDEDDGSEPDLDHPGTQGCILAQASERWRAKWTDDPSVKVEAVLELFRVSGGWRWRVVGVRDDLNGAEVIGVSALLKIGPIVPTYGEACVSALEGAPS
jgi:hypothetical protein